MLCGQPIEMILSVCTQRRNKLGSRKKNSPESEEYLDLNTNILT